MRKDTPQVRRRRLGQTDLWVSELGFGGHSWSFRRVPDKTGYRVPTLEEAVEMLAAGLDLGVNFIDACSPHEEHLVPGAALRRLGRRDDFIICARLCHKMQGTPEDRGAIRDFVRERLRMWGIDHFDVLILSNVENDTPAAGLWEMSYSIEALEEMKRQGKIRYCGFGSHFTPRGFLYAAKKYGAAFDVCSMPYNVRHRAAETVMPAMREAGLGVVTIKPFARGSLLGGRDLEGAHRGLARDLLAFVLQNEFLDCCICGMHSVEQVRENFSASWTGLPPEREETLLRAAAAAPLRVDDWLDRGWRYV